MNSEAHETAGNDGGSRNSDDPAHVCPCNHAPINRSPVAITEANAYNSAGDALRGGNRKPYS
jgi:hypothetical protein